MRWGEESDDLLHKLSAIEKLLAKNGDKHWALLQSPRKIL